MSRDQIDVTFSSTGFIGFQSCLKRQSSQEMKQEAKKTPKMALISPDNTNHSVKLLFALTTNRCHIDMALTDDC